MPAPSTGDPARRSRRFVPDAGTDATAEPADLCLVVAGRRLLGGVDAPLPSVADLPAGTEWVPLGSLDGARVWATGLPGVDERLGDWHSWPALAGRLGEPLAALAGRALQVITWRRTHRFCGACATELADVPGEHARRCPACELYVPMQLSPAVLTAITRTSTAGRPQLLLVRHTYGPTAIWALVAGFVEAGETLEDAVHREVAEEVGLEVHDVGYFGSQPWAMSGPGVVLAGFTARAAPQAEPVVDGREIAEARWFDLDDLPAELPPTYSISRWLIDHQRTDHQRTGGSDL
ncbi:MULTISPECIES: NAD(+) diphosphatase [unclassified Solwaraspora]|uniref:NAD(+) diphosphatase n=1 Tax=unclassified Solwaraspora TaxID=2627926 RepID=UPI00259BC293|nr:NAD(+) diphosphatase [Solwaraspora sp. WMMA2056]WJK42430.1 NAD(+) diphosphatase [Solwaraspora sp. WMMA2056]